MIVYRIKQYGLLGDRVLKAGNEYFPAASRRMDNANLHTWNAKREGRRALTNPRTIRTAIREENLKEDRAIERIRNEQKAARESYYDKKKELSERRKNKEIDWNQSRKIDKENYEEMRQAVRKLDENLEEESRRIHEKKEKLWKMPAKSEWDIIKKKLN